MKGVGFRALRLVISRRARLEIAGVLVAARLARGG